MKDEELQKKLDRLAGHKTHSERTFHRSLKELKALQTKAVIQAAGIRQHVPPAMQSNGDFKTNPTGPKS